jgi:hypothetical protein
MTLFAGGYRTSGKDRTVQVDPTACKKRRFECHRPLEADLLNLGRTAATALQPEGAERARPPPQGLRVDNWHSELTTMLALLGRFHDRHGRNVDAVGSRRGTRWMSIVPG